MDWAQWGPTVVSLVTCIFFAGVLYSNQNNHAKLLNEHSGQLDDHTRDLTSHAVKIGMLEAWKDGYAAARAAYQRHSPSIENMEG
jgi:iron uptake system EfeUOB component EfeO/EfeM